MYKQYEVFSVKYLHMQRFKKKIYERIKIIFRNSISEILFFCEVEYYSFLITL